MNSSMVGLAFGMKAHVFECIFQAAPRESPRSKAREGRGGEWRVRREEDVQRLREILRQSHPCAGFPPFLIIGVV
jgi:hypothetical protein